MMNDSIFQECLSQVDPFLWFAYLSNLSEPGHKLAAKGSRTHKVSSKWQQALASVSHQPATGDSPWSKYENCCKEWYLYPVALSPTFLEEMLCRRFSLFPSLP